VGTPSNPFEVGHYDTPGWASDVYVSGDYAYVADENSGLRIIDISDSSNPSEEGFYDTPGQAVGVYVSGDYAYVADRDSGLRILDINNPSNPFEAGFYDTHGDAHGVYVYNQYAYVADGNSGLGIIDVSNLSSIFEVNYYDTDGIARGVYVSGDNAYIADYWSGLRIINIYDPLSLSEVGYYDTPGWAIGVYVSGDYAYVADSASGLWVFEYIDLIPPNQPPVANAGPDQTVIDEDNNGEEQVTLDGSASQDPDGTIASFVWSEDGLQIATGINPTVILSTGTHSITLTVTDNGGLKDTDSVTIKVLEEGKGFGELPTGCYNNVFNPTKGEKALIVVKLSKQAHVRLNLYNARGNRIRELADEEKEAGTHKYYWDGKSDNGNVVGSGLYFVHIQAGDYKKTKKIVVVK